MIWPAIALAEFGLGFILGKMQRKPVAKTLAWLMPAIALPLGYMDIHRQAPWYIMLVLILLLFLGMKTVALVYRYAGSSKLTFGQWCFFALGWVGMDAGPFTQRNKSGPPAYKPIAGALLSIATGALLLLLLAILQQRQVFPAYLLCLLSFPAFIMILHSGFFSLAIVLYGRVGVNLTPLMHAPLQSESLGEFWGKRWNTAFIQMTRITLFVPFAKRMSAKAAFICSFLLSGLFHEVAISLPVGKGFGVPTIYFLLQAICILVERRFPKGAPLLLRRIWTFGCLILPFPLLFHEPFMNGCVLPLLEGIGSIYK